MNTQPVVSIEESILNAHSEMQNYLDTICLPIAENLNVHELSILCGKMFNYYNNNNVYINDKLLGNFIIPTITTNYSNTK